MPLLLWHRSVYLVRQLDSQDYVRIHLVRLQVMRMCPNHLWFSSISVTNPAALRGKTVIDGWFIQSAKYLPFSKQFPRMTSQMVLCNKLSDASGYRNVKGKGYIFLCILCIVFLLCILFCRYV